MSKKTLGFCSTVPSFKKIDSFTVPEIIDKIKTLHSRNKEKQSKAQEMNKRIVEDFLSTKENYEGKLKQREDKAGSVIKQQMRKTQDLQKKNGEKMKKIVEKLKEHKEKQNKQRRLVDRKSQQKMKKAEEKRKGTNMSQSAHKPSKVNFNSVFHLKKIQNLEYAEKIRKKSEQKLKQAEQRREYEDLIIECVKEKFKLREKVRTNAEEMEKTRTDFFLRRSVIKEEYVRKKLKEILNTTQEAESKKRQHHRKHQEKVKERKKKNQQMEERKNEKMLKESESKILKHNEKKNERISAFLERLHLDKLMIETKVTENYKKIKEKERQKSLNLHKKDLKQWNFLTSIKYEKDKLIESNIFDNNQLSLQK